MKALGALRIFARWPTVCLRSRLDLVARHLFFSKYAQDVSDDAWPVAISDAKTLSARTQRQAPLTSDIACLKLQAKSIKRFGLIPWTG
jgi:hypothetical protein